MIVYHGTILKHAISISENGIDLTKSKQYLDFGRGFYTTDNYDMAKNMALRVSARELQKDGVKVSFATIISFDFRESNILKYKVFEHENIDWAKFIIANRVSPEISDELGLTDNNHNLKYDIVIGGTADGNIANIASALRLGRLKPEEYIFNLSDFLKRDGSSYGKQIVFCTNESLSCIKYIKCDIIKIEKR